MAYAEVRALVRDRPTRALSEADPDTRDGPGEQRRAERLRHQQGGRQDRDGDGDERQPQRRRRLVARQYPVANPSMAPRAAGVPRRRRIVPAGMIMLKPTNASSVPTVATGHQDPCPPVAPGRPPRLAPAASAIADGHAASRPCREGRDER